MERDIGFVAGAGKAKGRYVGPTGRFGLILGSGHGTVFETACRWSCGALGDLVWACEV